MMHNFFRRPLNDPTIVTSKLYDQDTFFDMFLRDISRSRTDLVIESPFITTRRMNTLLPVLQKLRRRNVRVVINTRHPDEHEGAYKYQAEVTVEALQAIGVTVLYTAKHHRKLAIIDQTILWEGSLNILSHNDSCEIMRRTSSPVLAMQMIQFIKIYKYLVR